METGEGGGSVAREPGAAVGIALDTPGGDALRGRAVSVAVETEGGCSKERFHLARVCVPTTNSG